MVPGSLPAGRERPGSPAWVAGPLPTAEAARAGLRVDAEPWSAIPVIVEGAEPGVAYRAIVDRTVEGSVGVGPHFRRRGRHRINR